MSTPRPRARLRSPAVRRSALALTLGLALTSAGCRSTDESSPGAAVTPTPNPGTAELRASVPVEGYDQYDPQEIEAGRRDASWRLGAEWDRQERTRGPWLTGYAPGATDGVTPGPTAAPGAPGSPTSGAAATGGSGAPIERLRQAGDAPAPSQPASPTSEPAAPPAGGQGTGSETWEGITPAAFESFQPQFPVATEDGGPTVLAVQQLLDRLGFSPGIVDGRWGKNTEKALFWLQDGLGLEPTGSIDAALFERLRQAVGTDGPVTTYRVTAEDVAGPFTAIPEDYQEKAKLDCMCYTSAAEALAERFHTSRDLLARLNPEVNLDQLAAGAEVLVPDVEPLQVQTGAAADAAAEGPQETSGIAALVISKDGFYLHAVDAEGRVLYHFPTTVGAGYDASPSEELKVTGIAFRPTFHYQPELFHEVPDDEPTALLKAGPNSPVGIVWMQLSKEHFGIHGTAEPATIGYSTSHGCVRLTNWDAQFLAERVPQGTKVMFRGDHPDDASPTASATPSPTPAG